MGWNFRKSINLGSGLRLNLSKNGVGASTGVRGFRFGLTARGKSYVQCGTGGIYYRKTFGNGATLPGNARPYGPLSQPKAGVGPQIPILSGDVSLMYDSSAADLLEELNRNHKKLCLHHWIPGLLLLAIILAGANQYENLADGLAVFLIFSLPVLWVIDRKRKTTELHFDMDQGYAHRYRQLLASFESLSRAKRVWSIESEATVYNRKYHAGASSTLARKAISPKATLPPYVKGNIKPPMLQSGKDRIYFLPHAALVYQGSRVGAVSYSDLNSKDSTTQFIESSWQPSDARRVGTTWRFVNKDGGPDKRFSNNRSLPIMLYGELRLQSPSGLNEEFHVSNPSALPPFVSYLVQMRSVATSAPRPTMPQPLTPLKTPWPKV